MSSGRDLTKANVAANDEFYTLYEDIENELSHYAEQFKGKIIYCNCDDPNKSNFWKYFHLNFEKFGIKKLVASCYSSDFLWGTAAYKKVYQGGNDYDSDIGELTILKGNGDFRSAECLEILKCSDIIITNPPFSLFKEWLNQVLQYDKKFLVVGNPLAIVYNQIFPYFMEKKIWLGYKPINKGMLFKTTGKYQEELLLKSKNGDGYRIVNGEFFARANACWLTNMDVNTNRDVNLVKIYNPVDYPKYDNYDAIEVGNVADIPYDYDGIMGVPIQFIGKQNPEKYEILGMLRHGIGNKYDYAPPILNGKLLFTRILIKRRK